MREVKVKICGVTNTKDALAAVELGAQFIGLIFVASSPRLIKDNIAREIVNAVTGRCQVVGVFQDGDLKAVHDKRKELNLDLIQLHGSETPEFASAVRPCLKVLSLSGDSLDKSQEYAQSADYLLFDRAKTGRDPNWLSEAVQQLAETQMSLPFLLAGGITPDNVSAVVKGMVGNRSFLGIDVASGVESAPGVKDHEKIRSLMKIVREVSQNAIAR